MRFITVTNSKDKTKMVLNANTVQGMYVHENGKSTILKHDSHNNGGYTIDESIKEILKLIEQSKTI
jgi:hypothetical protein